MSKETKSNVPEDNLDKKIYAIDSNNLREVIKAALSNSLTTGADYNKTYSEGSGYSDRHSENYNESGYKDSYHDSRMDISDLISDPDSVVSHPEKVTTLSKEELLAEIDAVKNELIKGRAKGYKQ